MIDSDSSILNHKNKIENSPLLELCLNHQVERPFLDYLYSKGLDINSQGVNRNSVLKKACLSKNFPMIDFLIDKGTDLEYLNPEFDLDSLNLYKHVFYKGSTCLYFACEKGFYDVAKRLVERGANVNTVSRDLKTLLHIFAKKQYKNSFSPSCEEHQLLDFLFDHGIDPNLKVDPTLLLDEKTLALYQKESWYSITTPLLEACRQDNVPFVEYLLSKGADLEGAFELSYQFSIPVQNALKNH